MQRMGIRQRALRAGLSLTIAVSFCAVARAQSAARRTVWDGVFTQAQADQGKAEYQMRCARCHLGDLTGYQSALRGDRFMAHWSEDKVGSFFDVMKTTMPRGAPGSLEDGAYLKILAYVLQENGFPAGMKELQLEDLDTIQVEGKSGPGPVPAGSFVDVYGCLVQDGPGSWKLTRASDLVRTRNPQTFTPDELKSFDGRSGTNDYGLLDSSYLNTEARKNQKVAVKALVIRVTEKPRLNVTTLYPTGSTSEPTK